MLVFVTGSVGTFKSGIAYEISRVLNQYDRYPIGNYTANINTLPIEVYDSANNIVYRPATPSNPVSIETLLYASDGGYGLVRAIDAVESKTDPKLTYYSDKYNNLGPDLGLLPLESEGKYEDFIKDYQNSIFPNFVVSGTFSKNFIERVAEDVGVDNVLVINISRNPSIAYMIDETPQASAEWFAKDDMVGQVFIESILNNIVIQQLESVSTINLRYEDIIKNQQIVVLEHTIELPQLVKYNDFLTQYEVDTLASAARFSAKLDRLAKVNAALTALDQFTSTSQLPSNVFDVLGYTPLLSNEVLSS